MILGAATLVAAFGVSGCGNTGQPPATPPPVAVTTSTPLAPPPAAPLPPPETLTDVLYRLADLNVPGAQKLGLVEFAGPDDAAAMDKFGQALSDGGFAPLTFEARDLAWSQAAAGTMVATVVVRGAKPRPGGDFSYPMEFVRTGSTWQLSRHTVDLLLQLGSQTTPTPTG